MYKITGKEAPYLGKEDDLQKAVANYLKYFYPSALWFHCPNGGSRNVVEAAKLKSMGVLPGVSDIVILEKKKGRSGLLIELKVKGGTIQKTQKEFLNKAAERGFDCFVCYNLDSAMETIFNYLN